MTTQFGLFVNNSVIRIAESPTALKDQFCAEFGAWKMDGEMGPAPVIRRTTATVLPRLVTITTTGSAAKQVEAITAALVANPYGQVMVSTNSQHIINWATGTWKAKSAVAQALLGAIAAHGNVVVVFAAGDAPLFTAEDIAAING